MSTTNSLLTVEMRYSPATVAWVRFFSSHRTVSSKIVYSTSRSARNLIIQRTGLLERRRNPR